MCGRVAWNKKWERLISMKKALVVGGNSGVGLSLSKNLLNEYDHVYIVGRDDIKDTDIPADISDVFKNKTSFVKLNLIHDDLSFFDGIGDINTLIITAGFGRVALFEDLTEAEVNNILKVNCLSIIRILKKFYGKIHSDNDFYVAVMGSIAGHVSSPYFSVYSAAKTALCRFIENINIELEAAGYKNRILDVSPGSLKGTAFNGGENNIMLLDTLTRDILTHMLARDTLYIPQYDDIYKDVILRYNTDPQSFGLESYKYKKSSGRISDKPQVTLGYLSGTFDLFHIGHLNLLRRAKGYCDYLIVGVHRSGSWKGKETFIPFEERCAILNNIKFVDEVIEAPVEDSDAWDMYHYDRLFVGSDYKGSERFNRYEKYLEGRAEIIYFPYTQGTSSTQLRDALGKKK